MEMLSNKFVVAGLAGALVYGHLSWSDHGREMTLSEPIQSGMVQSLLMIDESTSTQQIALRVAFSVALMIVAIWHGYLFVQKRNAISQKASSGSVLGPEAYSS
jgi:hypothetical protein